MVTSKAANVASVETCASRLASGDRLRETGTIKAAERYKLATRSIESDEYKVQRRRLSTQPPVSGCSRAAFQGCRPLTVSCVSVGSRYAKRLTMMRITMTAQATRSSAPPT